MGVDKFIQPLDGIHVVSRTTGPRIPFGDEELMAAASRVKYGEPLEDVALDMAIEAVALEESLKTFRAASWSEWLHPRHEAGTKEGGQFAPVGNDQGALHRAVLSEVDQHAISEHERLIRGIYQPLRVGSADIQDMKAANANRIADRMIQEHGAEFGLGTDYGEETMHRMVAERVAKEMDTWAETSGDSKPEPVAMQYVARDLFAPEAPVDHLRAVPDPATLRDPGSRAFLEAEYEATQKFLASKGIKEATVFRGFYSDNLGDTLPGGDKEVLLQPMSSWATTPRDSASFAGPNEGDFYGAILVAQIPASRIQSVAVVGRGCLEENEIIVRGGKLRTQAFLRLPGESKGDFAARVGTWVAGRSVI
jgi:hypothetical protein